MFSHIQEALGHYLSGLSAMHEGAYPGWKADEQNPGYMIRIDPPVIMRAPYHLVCAFPSETSLDAIWHLSRNVKTLPTSVLCLSGSAAIFKSSVSIGDIDFCEYVVGATEDIARALTSKLQGVQDLMFKRLRIGTGSVNQANDETEIKARLHSIQPDDPDLSHAKIDFIGKPEGMRPTDVSNVMIFCDETWRSASLHRSFAAQEAHLDPVVAVPNTLCEPYQMGRYVDFLLGQAHLYFEKRDFAKSLKRCLSLARLCFLSSVSEEITRYISMSPEFLERELASVDELSTYINSMGLAHKKWSEELDWVRQDLRHDLIRARRQVSGPIHTFSQHILTLLDAALAGKDLKAA